MDQYWSASEAVLVAILTSTMKEKTKCSGEGGRMSWCISELRVQGWENEMR